MISGARLSACLKSSLHDDFSFIQKLKITHRHHVCPFDDLLSLIPEHSSVFDIGFGVGVFLALVAEFNAPTMLGGIEVSSANLDAATLLLQKGKGANARLALYDGAHVPPWIASYEYVCMIDVLHHIPTNSQKPLLQELYKSMAPGSKLIIKDIDAGSPFLIFNKLHDLVVSQELTHESTPAHMLQTLESVGFKANLIFKKRLYVYPHYTIVAEKVR